MNKNKNIFLSMALCLLAVFLFPISSVTAQTRDTYTDIEKAGFAFHKLSGFDPDFNAWIFQSKTYKEANPIKKVEILQNDIYRLQTGFYNYLPDTDLISITLPLLMKVPTEKDVEGIGDYSRVNINFKNLPENYLPIQIGNLWVAVVIQDFGRIAGISLSSDQYQALAKKLKGKAGKRDKSIPVTLEIKLRALSVDSSAPMILEDTEMWLMLADIGLAELSIPASKSNEPLWRYKAPWYLSTEEKDLIKLYK